MGISPWQPPIIERFKNLRIIISHFAGLCQVVPQTHDVCDVFAGSHEKVIMIEFLHHSLTGACGSLPACVIACRVTCAIYHLFIQ